MSKSGVKIECRSCGCNFTVPMYRKDSAKFCSMSCRARETAKKHLNKGPKPWAAANFDGHRGENKGSFKKGKAPWNKDLKGIHLSPKSEFKKGRESEKRLPVGSVTIRTDKAGNLRAWVKCDDGWKPRAQLAYIKAYGAIPDGCIVHHKDRDSLNDNPRNLEALTPAQHLEEHRGEFDS